MAGTLRLVTAALTRTDFNRAFVTLATALRSTDTDPAAIAVYFEALHNLDASAVLEAARQFSIEHGRRYMPTTAEWHGAAVTLKREADLREVVSARPDPWHYECEVCEDTGWTLEPDCAGDGNHQGCWRTSPHRAHTWTRICTCRPHNRTYQRHQRVGSGAA